MHTSTSESARKTQHGWGPEFWGLSLEQVLAIKTYPGYNQLSMREFLFTVIKPLTDGTEMGYALLLNKEEPLKAKVFIDVSICIPLTVLPNQ